MTEKTDTIEQMLRLLAGRMAGLPWEMVLPADGIRGALQGMLLGNALPVSLPGEPVTDTGGASRREAEIPAERYMGEGKRGRARVTPYEAAREARRQSELLFRT